MLYYNQLKLGNTYISTESLESFCPHESTYVKYLHIPVEAIDDSGWADGDDDIVVGSVGWIDGFLVLGKQAYEDSKSLMRYADDADGDLSHVIGTLLNNQIDIHDVDLFYCATINFLNEIADQEDLCEALIEDLPSIIFNEYYIKPGIIAFYFADDDFDVASLLKKAGYEMADRVMYLIP